MESAFLVSYAALWVLVVIQGVVLVGLVSIVGRLHDANAPEHARAPLPGLEPGTPVPTFRARDLDGRQVVTSDLTGSMNIVLFVSPSCSSCVTTLDEMVGLSHKARGNVLVVCQADKTKCAQLAQTYGLVRTIPDPESELSQLFKVPVLPTAVLIDRSGRVQSYGQPSRAAELEHVLDGDGLELAEATGAIVR